MIYSLEITDHAKTSIKWWQSVPALQKPKFTFNPGLTILWGRNGCGKSSLLRLLARLTHCEQAGTPAITESSISALRDSEGVSIVTDGQPVHFCDPSMRAGLIGGMAGFDYDFMAEGLATLQRDRLSSGQSSLDEIGRIMQAAGTIQSVPSKVKIASDHPAMRGIRPAPDIAIGPRTLLFDEPERSLDIPQAAKLWDILARQTKFQIIVASHSALSLGIQGATYVEFEPGYVDTCRLEVLMAAGDIMKLQESQAGSPRKEPNEGQ